MTFFGFRKRGHPDRAERDVVADCEAFLSGGLAERFEGLGLVVPAWAWMNLLAHGTVEEVESETIAAPKGSLEARDWRGSRAFLAAEVLAIADGPGSLVALQERVIRPFELHLAASSDARWWTPKDLARQVYAVLESYRANQRRAVQPDRLERR